MPDFSNLLPPAAAAVQARRSVPLPSPASVRPTSPFASALARAQQARQKPYASPLKQQQQAQQRQQTSTPRASTTTSTSSLSKPSAPVTRPAPRTREAQKPAALDQPAVHKTTDPTDASLPMALSAYP